MTDERPIEGRIARQEACSAKLEERVSGLSESIREWKIEVLRRLDDNNENARKLMDERARDRAELVTQDTYNAQYSEIKSRMEGGWREGLQAIAALSGRIDTKMVEHERADNAQHRDDAARIKLMEDFISNLRGRFWALGVAAAAVSAVIATLIQILFRK